MVLTGMVVIAACHAPVQVAGARRPGWAVKVQARTLHNLYKVDDVLYRCEQPSAAAMHELQKQGVKTVLNLRRLKSDPRPHDAPLNWVHVRINTWTISYKDILKALAAIEKAPKPVVVHCKHGSDRTGCVVAAWCLVKHNYSKEQVIDELRYGGYHFHERYFKNIIRLIESLDVEQLKADLLKWEMSARVKNS